MNTFVHLPLGRLLHGLAIVALCVSLAACDDDDPVAPAEDATITEFVDEQSDLSTFSEALLETGLGDTLNNEGPYTVFAPTNEAFEEVAVDSLLQNDQLLADVVQYHIIPSAAFASDLSDGQTLETLQGEELTVSVSGDTIQVGGATVVNADLEAQNGVVHIVDEVILSNRSIYERLSLMQRTQALAQVLDTTGLATALDAPGAIYTIFAPTDEALDQAALDTLTQQELTEIVQYHAISGEALAASEVQDSLTATTLQGEEVTLTREDGEVFVNDVPVTEPDLEASNGIIHLLDGVLLPPSLQDTAATSATMAF